MLGSSHLPPRRCLRLGRAGVNGPVAAAMCYNPDQLSALIGYEMVEHLLPKQRVAG